MKKDKNPIIKADWKETVIPEKPADTHKHYFEFGAEGMARCRHCPLTLIGVLEIKDGLPVL